MGWKQNPDTGESYWVEETQNLAPVQSKKQYEQSKTQPPAFQGTPEFWAGQAAQQDTKPAPASVPSQNWWERPQPTQGASGHFNTAAPFGTDQSMPGVAEQNWEYNQDKWYQSPQLDWANTQMQQFGTPGYGEQYNEQQMGQYGKPGQGQQYWNQVQGKFNEKGQYNNPNLASESYQRTVKNLPGSIQSTFDSAFDRAREKSVGAANQQASARGAYGSSAALNGVNSVITDIEAQRANRAGDFALQDSANQRQWLDSAANQGRSADLSGLGIFGANLSGLGQFADMAFRAEGADLDRDKFSSSVASGIDDARNARLGMGIDSALGIDSANLSRLNSGNNAAVAAQAARDNRVNDVIGNNRGFQNDITGFLSDQLNNVFSGDQEAFNQWLESIPAVTLNDKNDAERTQERVYRDGKTVADVATGRSQSGGEIP